MIKVLYQCGLTLFFLINIPKMLGMFFFGKKYQSSFLYRLGIKKQTVTTCDIWVHGVSLGEVKLALKFIETFKQAFPKMKIALSCSTEAGMEEGKKNGSLVNSLFYLPIDYSYLLKPIIKKINPKMVVFVEGDLWANFLSIIKNHGAKIAVINAKLSSRSFNRYLKVCFFARWVFSKVDLYCCQNQDSSFSIGHFCKSVIKVTGNMKFDLTPPVSSNSVLKELKDKLGLDEKSFLVVIGSTHPLEEEILIDAIAPLAQKYAHLKVAIVPRHPHRFEQVNQLFKKKLMTCSLYHEKTCQSQWVIVDAMGVLTRFYELCDLAIVAGSFVPIGGHNLLEPLSFGKMTCFGPYMFAQKQLAEQALVHQLAVQMTIDAVAPTLENFLLYPEKLVSQKTIIKDFFDKNQGATARNLEELKNLFSILNINTCDKSIHLLD